MMNVSAAVNTTPMAPAYNGVERAPAAAPVATVSGNNNSAPEVSEAQLAKLMEEPIKQANKTLAPYNRYIEREMHEVTKAMMYTIRDSKTDEVIAEYPPREIQDMLAKMWEMAGLLLDQKG